MDNTCEVCGHDDMETAVVNAAEGPFSVRMCPVCAAMNAAMSKEAVLTFGLDACTWYDSNRDSYVSTKGVLAIKTTDGKKFVKRADVVRHVNENFKS